MVDMEKIIKAIECCVVNHTRCFDDNDKLCPYFSTKVYMCEIELLKDVLATLKEQDAVAPLTIDDAVSEIMDKHYKRLKEKEAVVRCNDCRYGYCINPSCDEKEKIYECTKYPIANLRITHKPDWYCADGELKEGVHE